MYSNKLLTKYTSPVIVWWVNAFCNVVVFVAFCVCYYKDLFQYFWCNHYIYKSFKTHFAKTLSFDFNTSVLIINLHWLVLKIPHLAKTFRRVLIANVGNGSFCFASTVFAIREGMESRQTGATLTASYVSLAAKRGKQQGCDVKVYICCKKIKVGM